MVGKTGGREEDSHRERMRNSEFQVQGAKSIFTSMEC